MTPDPPVGMRIVVPRRPDRRRPHLVGGSGPEWSGGNRRRQTERRCHDLDIERQRADALYPALVEDAPEALAVLDVQGKVVIMNRAFEQLFDYGPGILVGEPARKLLPAAAEPAYSSWCRRCAALAQPLRMTLVGRRRNGTEFPLELALNHLATAHRRLIAVSVRDVTEHQHTLTALRQQALHLVASNVRLRARLEALQGAYSALVNAGGRCPGEPGM